MKILVADDSSTIRSLLTEYLTKLGHHVVTVRNSDDALENFQNNKPDLIILDVIMEGIDGFECAKRIRALDPDDWVPIIFLSGAVDDENIAKGINAGGDDYLTKPISEITLASKIKAMQRIAHMRQKLYDTTKKLSALSSTDVITGIYNRLQFDKTIAEKIKEAEHTQQPLALLFLDLDNFKSVNDRLGHVLGDKLLKEVARRLLSALRINDFIARIGGDEFAIIVNDNVNEKNAAEIAQKLINLLSKAFTLSGYDIHITTSIGIAFYPSSDGNPETIVQKADIAMYHAKELGRNNYQFYTHELNAKHTRQNTIENLLKFAYERREFILKYQPIYDLETKSIICIEGLVFWKHPSLGEIPPAEFMTVAEELGLGGIIGKWALRNLCEQSKKWLAAGFTQLRTAIKLSARQLLQQNFIDVITNLLTDTELPPALLEFEINENSVLLNSPQMLEVMKKIHTLGINIVIDHFGTGFSSLVYLKNVNLQGIKIDKMFIQDLDNPIHRAILKSIITLGNELKLTVVADSIETTKELQFLLQNGCTRGQGNLLCDPMIDTEMTSFLEKQKIKNSVQSK